METWNQQQSQEEPSDKATERECTNIPALILFIIFIILTLGVVGFCSINRVQSEALTKLQDDCGYICGELNEKINLNCNNTDLRNYTKLLVKRTGYASYKSSCIEMCPKGYSDIKNHCLESGVDVKLEGSKETFQAFLSSWHLMLLICFVSFVFSYICLILYRYCAKYVIWIINIGFIVGVFAVGTYFLKKDPKNALYFYFMGVLLIIVLIIYRKEISLVAQIFKESSKALMDVPAIMFEPILTFIALLTSFIIFISFIFIIEMASKPKSTTENQSPMVLVSHIINGIAFIWFTEFIFGCQHFIIAGTISKWYFSCDKSKLDSPIWTTFGHLLCYHLGSICLGSMFITLVKILKMIAEGIKKLAKDSDNVAAECLACICVCIIELLEKALAYLIRNAYIIIALDGTPFFESGKRAFHLIMDNLSECYSVNQFGDIVLCVCRVLITLIAGFVAYFVMKEPNFEDQNFLPMITAIIFAFLIAHCFVTVFEMTVDTVFICYCIDIEENDGNDSPYFMSEKLKKVMMKLRGSNDENENIENGNNVEMQPLEQLQESNYPSPPNMQQPVYPYLDQPQNQYSNPMYQQQAVDYGQYPAQSCQYPGTMDPYQNQYSAYPGQPLPFPVPSAPYPSQQMHPQQQAYPQSQYGYPQQGYGYNQPPQNYSTYPN